MFYSAKETEDALYKHRGGMVARLYSRLGARPGLVGYV